MESHLVAEHNALTLSPEIPRSEVIGYYKGRSMTENDNLVNRRPVDLLAAFNAAHDPDIADVPAFAPCPAAPCTRPGRCRGSCPRSPDPDTSAGVRRARPPRPCRGDCGERKAEKRCLARRSPVELPGRLQ